LHFSELFDLFDLRCDQQHQRRSVECPEVVCVINGQRRRICDTHCSAAVQLH